MSMITEVRRTTMDTPRSPVSISTDSSRRNSLRPILPEQQSEPPTPVSPRQSSRLSRKRAASLDTESANQPRIEDLALNSASTTGPSPISDTREQVCLCQPDPKIPRPRNAFILYRQHYQAQVVAQNPGLANPEISKIIGEQWREQAPEVKEDWKRLAEEEKQRHQRQYPGYRYQPRRAGKVNGSSRPVSTSTADDPVRCPRCNGRYISTPSTPLTPFTPAFSASIRNGTVNGNGHEHDKPPSFNTANSQAHINEFDRGSYLAQMPGGRAESPRMAGPPSQMHQRRHGYPQPLYTHHEHDLDAEMMSPGPEFKRRRFSNDPRAYPQQPMQYSPPQQTAFARNSQVPMSAGPFRNPPQSLQQTMSRSSVMGPPQSAPIRSHMQQTLTPVYRTRTPTGTSPFDESLRLPPLQTQQLPAQTPTTHRPPPDTRQDNREAQAGSIEAMVRTIPFLNKLNVISKISPPLAAPGPTSPAQEIRGAVIAVEGTDMPAIREVGDFISEYLLNDAGCHLRTWVTDALQSITSLPISEKGDIEMQDVEIVKTPQKGKGKEKDKEMNTSKDAAGSAATIPDRDPFIDYLTTITQWHQKSRQITKFITTVPSRSSTPRITPPESQTSSSSKAPTPPNKVTPIALLPHGYSLTLSDEYSRKVPINDAYAPVDHWQWMATLWRGIVGPDLTVYVKTGGKEEIERLGAVEWMQQVGNGSGGRGIVVRVLGPEDGYIKEGVKIERDGRVGSSERDRERERGPKMDDKTRRRLGFEVGEWVRGIDAVGWGRN